MRDKLIELIGDAPYGLRTLGQAADELISVERIADHLIANADVPETNVGKWIPVSERLPEPHEDVLVYDSTAEEVTCACLSLLGEWFGVAMKNEVTHWMPMPEPPKEAEDVRRIL